MQYKEMLDLVAKYFKTHETEAWVIAQAAN